MFNAVIGINPYNVVSGQTQEKDYVGFECAGD